MHQNTYFQQELKLFKPSYFAFLDILGFKEKISLMEKNLEDTSLADFYANECKNYIQKVLQPDPKKDIKFQIFSDSIVLHCDQDRDLHREPLNLVNLLIAIAKIQSFMSSKGFWLRGAVTMGNLYSNESSNALMGTALIRAYELESKFAITPRVILDLEFYSKLGGLDTFTKKINSFLSNLNYKNWVGDVVENPQNFPQSSLNVHMDNLAFVHFFNDYLASVESAQRLLEAIKHIKSNLYSNPAVYDKMIWLTSYLDYNANENSRIKNAQIKAIIIEAHHSIIDLI